LEAIAEQMAHSIPPDPESGRRRVGTIVQSRSEQDLALSHSEAIAMAGLDQGHPDYEHEE